MRCALLALLLLASARAAGTTETAVEVLAGVAANARFPGPTVATLRLERERRGTTSTETGLLMGNRQTIYVETAGGTRALIHPGKIVVRSGAKIVRSPVGARVGDTDVLLEDLVPLTTTTLRVPQVSDTGPTGTVVTGAPAGPSTRALLVFTIDPELHVVTRTKCYEGSISDLAAFRRDEDFVDVRGHQRATHITIERPRDETSTRITLDWSGSVESGTASGLGILRGPALLRHAP